MGGKEHAKDVGSEPGVELTQENRKSHGHWEDGRFIIDPDVTSIGERAFSGCGGLTSIVIPPNVVSIGAKAFTYCPSLNSVFIPKSVDRFPRC